MMTLPEEGQLIAIAVIRHEDRWLVGRRPQGAPLAGYWEFPGGKQRPDETPPDAAARECREETGVEVVLDGSVIRVAHEYPHGKLLLHFCFGRPRDSHCEPRDPFRWVTREELATLRFPPANRQVLERLLGDC